MCPAFPGVTATYVIVPYVTALYVTAAGIALVQLGVPRAAHAAYARTLALRPGD